MNRPEATPGQNSQKCSFPAGQMAPPKPAEDASSRPGVNLPWAPTSTPDSPNSSARCFLSQPHVATCWPNSAWAVWAARAAESLAGPPGNLAAEVFLLELLEVFLCEHGALSLLLLLPLGHGPVTGLSALVLLQNLGRSEGTSFPGTEEQTGTERSPDVWAERGGGGSIPQAPT